MNKFIVFCVLGLFSLSITVGSAGEEKQVGSPVVVAKILDVSYKIQTSDPPNLLVDATGEVPTGGYKDAVLTRVIYVKPPADGVQDFVLTAVKPAGLVPQVISKVKATNTWKAYTTEAPWLKGIRVHGVGDGVMEIMLEKE